MPKQMFALERGGPKRLTVSWEGNWKNLTLQLDGRLLLTIPTSKELKEGREVPLDAGRVLRVQLSRTFFGGTKLFLSLNGRPVPGSTLDPHARLATAYGTIYFVGGLSMVIGVLTEVFSVQFLKEVGFGWGVVVEGLVFLGLALWVHKRHSMVGLTLAVGLYGLDAIVTFATVASQPGASPPGGAVVVKILFIVYMSRGFAAIKELRQEEKGSVTPARVAPQ